jgi:uncharacterized protein (TIGR03790 family)
LRYVGFWLWLGLSWAAPRGLTQNALSSRLLLVYAANDPDSSSIAAYYQNQRGIPPANLCPLTLPDPSAAELTISDYASAIKTPIQSCLNAAGRAKVLYILIAYMRPYLVYDGSGLGDYALDSYLADIWDQYTTQTFNLVPPRAQPYYIDNQSQGNVYPPFQSLAAYRSLGTLPLIYSVWRLDGATPGIAMGLIDKALAAEANGGPLSQTAGYANACIDMTNDPTRFPDTAYSAGDWDLLRASQFLAETQTFNVVTDLLETVFGEAPSPDCSNTGLYAGWYNYGRYVDGFSWDPGSIGWDLDSGALFDPRGGIWWGPNALERGVTVTSGPVTEPYLEGLARPSGVMLDLLRGANVGDAFLRNTRWLKWKILNVGDPLYTPFPHQVPPFTSPLSGNSLSFNPREVVGGMPFSVALTLSAPAPSGGLEVDFASNDPCCAPPGPVTVPEGATSVTFFSGTAPITGSTDVVFTASANSLSVANTITVDPLLAAVGLVENSSPNSASIGNMIKAAVFLNASAPLSGITVQLSSDQPDVASVPASIFVPGGLSQTSFPISLSAVSSQTDVNITAFYGGATAVTTVSVGPNLRTSRMNSKSRHSLSKSPREQ